MRYFDIKINDTKGNLLKRYTSQDSFNNYNSSCPMIEFDIQKSGLSTPIGASLIRVWGVSVTDIRQAQTSLFNLPITMDAGMSKGLPLANPAQAGRVLDGVITNPFGNWQGTELSLDLLITANIGSIASPKNITLAWNKGIKLSVALYFCLKTAFPDSKITINISDALVASTTNTGFFSSLTQLASKLNDVSKTMIKTSGYAGVEITQRTGEIIVYDGAVTGSESAAKTITLAFSDMIGQPTWIEAAKIMVKLVLRADINIGDYIIFPKGAIASNTTSAYAAYRSESAFQGKFMVTACRLLGNSRQPDANSWCANIEAVTT